MHIALLAPDYVVPHLLWHKPYMSPRWEGKSQVEAFYATASALGHYRETMWRLQAWEGTRWRWQGWRRSWGQRSLWQGGMGIRENTGAKEVRMAIMSGGRVSTDSFFGKR